MSIISDFDKKVFATYNVSTLDNLNYSVKIPFENRNKFESEAKSIKTSTDLEKCINTLNGTFTF
jgi:hypothetical protein